MPSKSIQTKIAEHAGVSQTLVSFVVNNNEEQLARMKPETIARVREVAREMGYYRNELFAAVRRGQSRFIAVLARNVSMEYYARVVEEVMDATEEEGYTQKIFKLNSTASIGYAIKRIQEYRIPGGILLDISSSVAKKFYADLGNENFKTLLVDSQPQTAINGVLISVDNSKAMTCAVGYLKSLGHRRIAYVGPAEDHYFHRLRRDTFQMALEKKGLPCPPINLIPIAWDMSDRNEPLMRALQHRTRPTAMICYSDLAAMIVYHASRALSLSIPEDLSVIGFDDDDFAALMFPPLTTFRQDLSVIRKTFVPELIQSIESEQPLNRRKRRRIPVTLVERGSTGPASQRG